MRSWVLEGWLRGRIWVWLAELESFCIIDVSVLWPLKWRGRAGWRAGCESLWGHHAGEADEQQHSSGSSQSSVSSLNTSPWWSLNQMINNPQWTMNIVQLMCYNNNEHEMKVCDGCRVDDGGHADRKLFKTCYNLIVCRSSPVHRSCC